MVRIRLATIVALVICLITFFVVSYPGVRVNNRAKMKSQVVVS